MNSQWSFGIITGGGSESNISIIIDSIEKQNIKKEDYEIIIIGPCNIKRENTSIIPFNESIKKRAWITKKKNMIAQNAKFPNLSLLHDYMYLNNEWYNGYLNFTDEWDVCMNVILNKNGDRFRDWILHPPSPLDYRDHSKIRKMYVSGSYFCIKRDYFLKNPLDESRGWGQSEDVEWSFRLRDTWDYKCNGSSSVQFLKQKKKRGW